MLAMKRAVEDLSIKADFALIDGNKVPDLDIPAFPVVKGDSLSMSIACASILAKVSRDRLMYKYDENTRNMVLQNIRATVLSCTRRCLGRLDLVKFTDRLSLKNTG